MGNLVRPASPQKGDFIVVDKFNIDGPRVASYAEREGKVLLIRDVCDDGSFIARDLTGYALAVSQNDDWRYV